MRGCRRGWQACVLHVSSAAEQRRGGSLLFVQLGEIVDDFELTDQQGSVVRLTTLLADGPVVLFFYPKAMTPG